MPPLRQTLTGVLRTALADTHAAAQRVAEAGQARLGADPAWAALSDEQRVTLASQFTLATPPAPSVATEDDVLAALGASPLSSRRLAADALEARFGQALAEAARLAAPKASRLSLPGRLVSTTDEADAYLGALRAELLSRLADGPVLIG